MKKKIIFYFKSKQNSGFTLIEVLVYSALLGLIMTAMLGSVYMIIQAYNKTGSTVIVNDEANFILRKMNWALSCATSVTVPAAGATSTTLKLSRNNIPFSQNPMTFNHMAFTDYSFIERHISMLCHT